MWYPGRPAADQCEGYTWVTSQVRELSYIHPRDVTFAVFCKGPYPESARYRDFMGWEMPWYSAQESLDILLAGRDVHKMYIDCYVRQGSRVFETYWTTIRGVEAMDNNYRYQLDGLRAARDWETRRLAGRNRQHGNAADRWTSHLAMASPKGGISRQSDPERALTATTNCTDGSVRGGELISRYSKPTLPERPQDEC